MKPQTAFHRALILILPLLLAAVAQAVNVTVTSPSSTTATVPTNPTIVANASSGYPITAWYVYVDSKAAWNTTVDTSSISAPLTLTVGKHTVLVRAWDSSGAYGTTTLTLTASTTASPSTVTVSIASPANNATVGQPFTLNASATGGTVHGWYVYSDNVAVANGSGSTASPSLRLAAGTHRLLARFWNTAGTHGDAWLTVNVAASASAPTPPSNAVVFDKIEDMTGWGHCTQCAANPADPTPPLADYTFTQFQSTPS
ncbi:MAG TPA: hypothetical protein VL382_09055, partial [Terriglobales bacterium]|nr:hypothetical protein [Terriglobales bacterium]